jgi:hypothetical protein
MGHTSLYISIGEMIKLKKSIRKVSLLAITCFILLLLSNLYVQAYDEYTEVESNNTLANATAMFLDRAYSGKLGSSKDIDYYMFTLDNPGDVQVVFSHESTKYESTSKSWYVRVLDAENNEYQSMYSTGSETEKSINLGLSEGTYYIRLESAWSYLDMDYNIQVDYNQGYYYEKEFNNTRALATNLEFNSNYIGRLGSSSDVDYYKFTLDSPGNIQADFSHDSTMKETTVSSWYVKILDSENNEYRSMSSSGSDLDKKMSIGLPQGTYYIKILSASEYLSKDYSLQVIYYKSNYIEKEFNNTLTSANELELDSNYTGRLSSSSDIDYYKFTLNDPGNAQLKFTHESTKNETTSQSWIIRLLDCNNNEYYSVSSTGSEVEKSIDIGLPSGTYYIKVQSGLYYIDMDYNLQISFTDNNYYEKEFNDAKFSANEVELDRVYSGILNTLSDKDYYKFVLEEPKEIMIKFEHDLVTGNEEHQLWTVSLSDDSNREYTAIYSRGKDTSKSFTVKLDEGTYFLKVESNDKVQINKKYEISSNISYDSSKARELVQYALEQKNFYGFNIAYAEVMKITDENERDTLLSRLSTISDIIWTDDIKSIYADLRRMADTGSAQIYDSVQIKIDNSNLQQVDKDYLKTEVTSWGKNLVWTEDYKIAVSAILNAYSKKDSISISLAQQKIDTVKNRINRDYLLNELNNFIKTNK